MGMFDCEYFDVDAFLNQLKAGTYALVPIRYKEQAYSLAKEYFGTDSVCEYPTNSELYFAYHLTTE